MTIGYILILSILLLGGVLATAGDRIGTKVGKARLSLFNLRPKRTATLITIITGVSISATTLGILFATSKPLRKGVFEYDQTQAKLRQIRKDLEQVNAEKQRVETELSTARTEQSQAQVKLNQTNKSLEGALVKLDEAIAQQLNKEERLKTAQRQLSDTIAQKQALQEEIQQRFAERQALLQQLERGKSQIEEQNKKIEEKNQLIAQQNQDISQKTQELESKTRDIEQKTQELAAKNQDLEQKNQEIDSKNLVISEKSQEIENKSREIEQKVQEIEAQNQTIAQQEKRYSELATQQAYLEQEVQTLERDFKELQQGTIVLRRNQVLAAGVLRIVEPSAAGSAVDQLLQQANQNVIKITQPGRQNFKDQIIQITRAEVERLIDQIDDGQDYVVRILAGANYVVGEKQVQVFADAVVNRIVFKPGDVVAATSLDPTTLNPEQSRQRIESLLAASSFRARRVGILADTVQIGDGRIQTLINFIEMLQQQNQAIDVKAVAADVTYTAGPLRIDLVAVRNGEVLFHTCRPSSDGKPGCA